MTKIKKRVGPRGSELDIYCGRYIDIEIFAEPLYHQFIASEIKAIKNQLKFFNITLTIDEDKILYLEIKTKFEFHSKEDKLRAKYENEEIINTLIQIDKQYEIQVGSEHINLSYYGENQTNRRLRKIKRDINEKIKIMIIRR